MNGQEYYLVKSKISQLTKVDIDSYKSQQMRRRLEGFIGKYAPLSVADYYHMLENEQEKIDEFQNFLIINVWAFFHDVSQSRTLRMVNLPEVVKWRSRLNIWSAACSGGQESYSLVLILKELCPDHRHRILTTDLEDGLWTGQGMRTLPHGGGQECRKPIFGGILNEDCKKLLDCRWKQEESELETA